MNGLLGGAVGLVIGLVLGMGAAWLMLSRAFRSREAARIEAAVATAMGEERLRASQLQGQVDQLAADRQLLQQEVEGAKTLAGLVTPLKDSLEALTKVSQEANARRTEAEAVIRTQIEAVKDRYDSLEQATKQLVAAMAKGQTRGQWGEMQLEQLLSHAGFVEGTHYRRQETRTGVDGVTRPDIVVLLPGGAEILIDAKFPFDQYWSAIGTEDPAARDAALRAHANDVLNRAKELSSRRYSESGTSPDFVVMFLPLESILSAALDVDGMLLEKTFDKRVVLATPTTMLALLRTIAFGFDRRRMAENAEEIRAAGAEMLNRLSILVEHVEAMRRGLAGAVKGYNQFVGSFERQAMVQARRMRDMGVTSQRSLDSPEPIDAGLREPVDRLAIANPAEDQ